MRRYMCVDWLHSFHKLKHGVSRPIEVSLLLGLTENELVLVPDIDNDIKVNM